MNTKVVSEAHIVKAILDFCHNQQMKELKDIL
jgi:hypothetical protein